MRVPAFTLVASLPLALLVACGGGGGGSSSSRVLTYTNSASATSSDWRVEADSASNGTSTLLLRVYGPTGTAVQGATVFLTCNAVRTEWVQPSGATDAYALEGSALDFTQGPTTSVQLFKSRLSGSDLQVGAYQKTGTQTLTASKPLFTVALSPVSGATAGTASLAATSGKTSIYLDSTGEHELTLNIGTLVVK